MQHELCCTGPYAVSSSAQYGCCTLVKAVHVDLCLGTPGMHRSRLPQLQLVAIDGSTLATCLLICALVGIVLGESLTHGMG
jgi:hypothetical protein